MNTRAKPTSQTQSKKDIILHKSKREVSAHVYARMSHRLLVGRYDFFRHEKTSSRVAARILRPNGWIPKELLGFANGGFMPGKCGHIAVMGIVSWVCCVWACTVSAANAANSYVTVVCDAPHVNIEVTGNHFNIFAPGYPDSFVTNVMVRANGKWRLVEPRASDLPLQMSGGDTAGYAVVCPPEDSAGGTIAFHNYYIKSNQSNEAKDIVVAFGASVTYTARKNGSNCPSDWTVNEETRNDTSRIVFNRNWWDIPSWFFPSMDTPKPGLYGIQAHDVQHVVLVDSGTMTVVGIKKISGPNAKSSDRITSPSGGATWRESEVVYAQPCAVFNLTAEPEPGLSAAELDKIRSSITWSVGTGRITPSTTDPLVAECCAPDRATTYEVTASCGVSERIILVKVGVPKIHKVSFSGNIKIKRDSNGMRYVAPDWKDDDLDGVSDLVGANADSGKPYQPVAYLSTKTMVATGVFLANCTKVSNPTELIDGYDVVAAVQKLRFAPNDSPWSWNWSDPVSFRMNGTTVTAAQPFKAAPEVGYVDDYELAWEVGFGEAGTADDNLAWHRSRSNHELYLTYKAEVPSYETVFHLSCTSADGKKNDSTVIEGVWSGFTSRNVKRKNGYLLAYYRSYRTNANSLLELLQYTDGTCSAWVDFFMETLNVHGISFKGETLQPLSADGFFVKTWSFAGTGTSGNATFPYKNELKSDGNYIQDTEYDWGNVAEVTYTSGTPGQNNVKPAAFFKIHKIVYVPIMNAWYDPSYGIKYTSMQAIDNIFDGFLVQSGGGVHAFFLQKNPAGIQIKFQ